MLVRCCTILLACALFLVAGSGFATAAGKTFTPMPGTAWQVLDHAQGITTGERGTKPAIQIVFDVNSPYGAKLFERLRKHFPDTPVRWVPVAYIHADSATMAAAILAAPDPAASLRANFAHYNAAKQHGSYVPPAGSRQLALKAFQPELRHRWATEWGGYTPITLFRTAQGTIRQAPGLLDTATIERIIALTTAQQADARPPAEGANAKPASDNLFCRNGGFAGENQTFGMASLSGNKPVWFLDDLDGCPNAKPACQRGPVQPGHTLITGRHHGPYVCAFQRTVDGDAAGWVRRDRLQALPVNRQPQIKAWAGHWTEPDGSEDTVTITPDGNALAVTGHAYWPNANPPLGRYPGGPNLGRISGHAAPDGNRLAIGEASACLAILHLVNNVLVVHDNGVCGGMNVRFDGVYVRRDESPQ